MTEKQTALTETTYYILLSLYKPLHGYGIMQEVAAMSKGRVQLGAGTLYGALSTLVERSWIAEGAQYDRKKEYQITAAGNAVVQTEMLRLAELLENGQMFCGERPHCSPIIHSNMT
ncbi:MAG: PadR family transcriptional regulator [Coriobacteriales bacterium]|jgi:DNA-binding PadR family transcriptional regulator|nr:PadR family transcriptional regulator [Coriobacteriales bacterium]